MMLLCATMFCVSSCEKAEEYNENYPSIIGTWYELIDSQSGDYMSTDIETYWIFRSNGTATHKLDMKMNGVSIITENLDYQYIYKGTYIDFSTDKNSFRYNVSVNGNKMRLGDDDGGYFNLTKIE